MSCLTGEAEGLAVGDTVGEAEGLAVGDAVGEAEGLAVGDAVGEVEGLAVGDIVGLEEGDAVCERKMRSKTSGVCLILYEKLMVIIIMTYWRDCGTGSWRCRGGGSWRSTWAVRRRARRRKTLSYRKECV